MDLPEADKPNKALLTMSNTRNLSSRHAGTSLLVKQKELGLGQESELTPKVVLSPPVRSSGWLMSA